MVSETEVHSAIPLGSSEEYASSQLSVPLLSQEDDEDQKKEIQYDIDFEDEDEDEDDDVFGWQEHVMVLILFLLLFIQFGSVFYFQVQPAATRLDWKDVNYSILQFLVIAFLYRSTLHNLVECGSSCVGRGILFIQLAPEVLVDVVVAMVLFDKPIMAWLVMLLGLVFFSLFVLLANMYLLYVYHTEGKEEDEDEGDYTDYTELMEESARDKSPR